MKTRRRCAGTCNAARNRRGSWLGVGARDGAGRVCAQGTFYTVLVLNLLVNFAISRYIGESVVSPPPPLHAACNTRHLQPATVDARAVPASRANLLQT